MVLRAQTATGEWAGTVRNQEADTGGLIDTTNPQSPRAWRGVLHLRGHFDRRDLSWTEARTKPPVCCRRLKPECDRPSAAADLPTKR